MAMESFLVPMQHLIVQDLVTEGRRSLSVGDFSGLSHIAKRMSENDRQSISYVISDATGNVVAALNLGARGFTHSVTTEIRTTSTNATGLLTASPNVSLDKTIGSITVLFSYRHAVFTYWGYICGIVGALFGLLCMLLARLLQQRRIKERCTRLTAALQALEENHTKSTQQLKEASSQIECIFDTLALTLQYPVEALRKSPAVDQGEVTNLLTKRLLDNLSLLLSIQKPYESVLTTNEQASVLILGNCNGLRSVCLALKLKGIRTQVVREKTDLLGGGFAPSLSAIIDLDPFANDSRDIVATLKEVPSDVFIIGCCPSDYSNFYDIDNAILERVNWTVRWPIDSEELVRVINRKPRSFAHSMELT